MKDLSEAIYAKFSAAPANSFYTLVSGKLYKERAPQKATLPYSVYHLIDNVPDWTFSTFFEKARIQFDLFSDTSSSSQVEDMYTALKALYDWCELDIDNNSHVYMRRELARLSRLTDTIDYWQYTVDYEIMMERD